MKAAVIHEFGPPDVIKYEDVPDPVPREGEIRIRVGGATINRVLDVALRRGAQGQRGADLPLILGVDCAGTVDAVGPKVTRWKVGDRVGAAGGMPLDIVAEDGKGYAGPRGMMGIKRPGGFAEFVCVPAMAAHRLPDGLGFHEAAVVMRHCPTAWNLLFNVAQLQKDEWVLIMGASGNLGTVGIQIAKNVIGAKVITTAGRQSAVDIGLQLGADYGIDYSKQDIYDEIMKITDGKGVNVLYDNIANPHVLPKAFHTLGMNGRLVTAGAHGGPNVTIDFFHLYDRRITIKGMPGALESDLPKCFAAAADGKIKVHIAHVMPLSKAAEAHRLTEEDPGLGKIVLDPTLG
ncbi:zinc-binding dehydrogenase [Roseiarcaceae bacterium H3SJ34-1]|uniref:quinone oxidoreductase family protein n=1 Tax=Terripilifer ovatus TaxID=3032367 RepID=UPI003AB91F3E|nr:zinc-binding dehydrogenase [Roseiarcaceae bacterium H3SJ34-1]